MDSVTHSLTDIIWQTASLLLRLQQSAIKPAPNPHCHHSSRPQLSLLYLLLFVTETVEVRTGGVTSSGGCEPHWKPQHCM